MIRVGIPRALLYYQYYLMWKTFFEELGAEVVISTPTTKVTMAEGSSRVVADTCLPAKVYIGHVLSLVEKCDYVFIPAIRSLKSKTYNCAKFLGLPDMTRAVVPEAPPILEIDIDVNEGEHQLYRAIYKLGRHFTWNPLKVKRAAVAAWQAHLNYRGMMSSEGLTPPQAVERITGTPEAGFKVRVNPLTTTAATIGLIGHPYLLYDEHTNYQIIPRLEQANNRVLTPEMLSQQELETAVVRISGAAYWTYEDEVVGAGGHYLQAGVDGIIGIMAFGCGPDSLMMDMIRRQANRLKTTPFMCLTLEEHTSEAGVITRLEAFLDMIYRRKRKRVAVCV